MYNKQSYSNKQEGQKMKENSKMCFLTEILSG